MSKYNQSYTRPQQGRNIRNIHPVWQGIGCLLALLIPVMAYAGAVLLLRANQEQGWFALPADLTQTVSLPIFGPVPALYATLMAALLLAILGYSLLVILYSLLYQALAPQDPMEAPPNAGRRRR